MNFKQKEEIRLKDLCEIGKAIIELDYISVKDKLF